MTILRCLRNGDFTDAWTVIFLVLIVFFLGVFLYSVIPVLCYHREFANLSKLNRWSRHAFCAVLLLKVCCHIVSLSFGKIRGEDPPELVGVLFIEFPYFPIVTCYSLILLFWHSLCVQVLPNRYIKSFRIMRAVLLVFNVVIYILYIISVVFHSREIFSGHTPDKFSGAISVVRDFSLALILIIFVVRVKMGLREDSEADETVDEAFLMRFSIVLSVLLLYRGSVTLYQGIRLIGNKDECRILFLLLFCGQELLADGGPLIWLIHVNNRFLIEQSATLDTQSSLAGPLVK
jgi:hypothetical protein